MVLLPAWVLHFSRTPRQGLGLTALIDVVFFSCSCGRFFDLILNKTNSSPTLQRTRRMSCRPNPSPDPARVWLLPLPFDLSLHILRFINVFFLSRCFLSIFFPSISRLSTTPQPVLPPMHNLFICV